jgi:hypothetical protein
MNGSRTHVVFVSHAAIDHELAAQLKSVVENTFASVDVFVSSDPEDLPPGDLWIDTILNNLRKAEMLLAVTTVRGLSRKWVWFESGTSWKQGPPTIPCCVGATRKSDLPAPFSSRQALNIDEERDLRALFGELEKKFGRAQDLPDFSRVVGEFIRIDVRAEERFKVLQDPLQAAARKSVEANLARLNIPQREAIKILLVEGAQGDRYAIAKLITDGILREQWGGIYEGISTQTGLVQKIPGTGTDTRNPASWTVNRKVEGILRECLFPQS